MAGQRCPDGSVRGLAGSADPARLSVSLAGPSHRWRVIPVTQDCSWVNLVDPTRRADLARSSSTDCANFGAFMTGRDYDTGRRAALARRQGVRLNHCWTLSITSKTTL